MALITSVQSDGVDQYAQGSLVSAPSGDFELIWKGRVMKLVAGFNNLLCLYNTATSDYLGIALEPTGELKIISNAKTPGTGTLSPAIGALHTIRIYYTASTNTAEIFLDDVSDYTVNPTGGATWVNTLDGYRLFSASAIASFGAARISDGIKINDIPTPANNIELSVPDSSLASAIIEDIGGNNRDATLVNFPAVHWVKEFEPEPIAFINEIAVQGIARDATNFYMFNSAKDSSVDGIVKVALDGSISATNNSLYGSLPAPTGTWKTNDGTVDNGIIYVCPRDAAGGQRAIVRFNASDLTYISHTLISANDDFGASICVGSNGNLFLVPFIQTPLDAKALQVAEYQLDGTFVQFVAVSDYIYGGQGIVWDGVSYYISSLGQDTNANEDAIYKLDSSFNIVDKFVKNSLYAEIEGLAVFGGVVYNNDISQTPFIVPIVESTLSMTITGLPDAVDYTVDFTDPSTGELVARQTGIEFVSGSATSNTIAIAVGTTLEYTIRTATHIMGDSGVTA